MKIPIAALTLCLASLLIEARCIAQADSLNYQLMVAARRQDAKAIKKWLIAGAQMRSEEGEEAFGRAISDFNTPQGPEVLALMLKKGADINAQLLQGFTPLQLAMLNEHGEALPLFLLEHGATAVEKGPHDTIPIFQAAKLGYGEVIQALIKRGAKLDTTNAAGQTPLMALASGWEWPTEGWPAYREDEVVKLAEQLIQQGANPNRRDTQGKTAADYALDGNNYDLLRLLDKEKSHEIRYPEIKHKSQLRKLQSAIVRHMEERMNYSNCPKRKPFATLAFISALLDTGISPNTVLTNEHGSNTLFGMCFEKFIPTDPALIGLMPKRGADPNQRLGRGEVPLSIAAAEPDVFLALLDGGAAPNLIMEIPMLRVSESREPKVEQYALEGTSHSPRRVHRRSGMSSDVNGKRRQTRWS